MKYLWLLLPLVSFWALFYLGFSTVPPHSEGLWWGFPLLLTYTLIWCASFGVAFDKITTDSSK